MQPSAITQDVTQSIKQPLNMRIVPAKDSTFAPIPTISKQCAIMLDAMQFI